MRTGYLAAATSTEIPQRISGLNVKTAVVDVEPLVASWDTDHEALQTGLTAIVGMLAATTIEVLVFATNSTRRPPRTPTHDRVHIRYLASAGKPLRLAAYRHLPHPGVVIGDQIATDGILARRLGYTFLHYTPNLHTVPTGPRLMRQLGRPIRTLLFQPQ